MQVFFVRSHSNVCSFCRFNLATSRWRQDRKSLSGNFSLKNDAFSPLYLSSSYSADMSDDASTQLEAKTVPKRKRARKKCC